MMFKIDGKIYVIIYVEEEFDEDVDPPWLQNYWAEEEALHFTSNDFSFKFKEHTTKLHIWIENYPQFVKKGYSIFSIFEFESEQDFMFFCLRFN